MEVAGRSAAGLDAIFGQPRTEVTHARRGPVKPGGGQYGRREAHAGRQSAPAASERSIEVAEGDR